MAKKIKKIGLKKVKKVSFEVEIEDREHTFEFVEFSAKELNDMETTLEAQHEALKENTSCTTTGVDEDKQRETVDDLFEWIWENQPAGEWMGEMRELLGNDNKKK